MGLCSDSNKCISIVISTLVIYAAAITMVVVGTLNLPREGSPNGCPSAPGMPLFNVTGGSIIMIGLFVREIIKRFCECCNDCCDGEKCCRIGGKVLKWSTTLIYDLFFMLVTAIWLIAGTASVIESFREYLGEGITKAFGSLKDTSDTLVSTINIKGLDEQLAEQSQDGLGQSCDEILYNVTLVVLVSGWILLVLAVLYVLLCQICYKVLCCKPCKDDREDVYLQERA